MKQIAALVRKYKEAKEKKNALYDTFNEAMAHAELAKKEIIDYLDENLPEDVSDFIVETKGKKFILTAYREGDEKEVKRVSVEEVIMFTEEKEDDGHGPTPDRTPPTEEADPQAGEEAGGSESYGAYPEPGNSTEAEG